MHRSKIEWTDYSGGYANFVRRGKRKGECEAGPGCAHCYVTRIWPRNPDAWPDETTFYPGKLAQLARCQPRPGDKPYRRGEGSRPMVFLCDTGDLFHRRVHVQDILQALDVLYGRPDIDWQILTKRYARAPRVIEAWLQSRGLHELPPWMWLIYSVEDAARALLRVPYLVQIPAAVRGLSLEPLLEPVDLAPLLFACPDCGARPLTTTLTDWRYDGERWQHSHGYPIGHVRTVPDPLLHWIIVGGESGTAARLMPPHAVWLARTQAQDAGVAFFFKQWGDAQPADGEERERALGWGWDPDARRGGHTFGGRTWAQFPRGGHDE